MSAPKLERLVNLLMLLLSARRPVTVEQIREMLPAYDQDDPESFRRQFERDKEELRELGIPLETGFVDAWEVEQGYWIRRDDYELPPISLAPDEATAVALAARLWQSAALGEASASALLKLRAAGIEADPVETTVVEPRVAASDAAFEPLLAAVRAGQAVTFDYVTAGGTDPARRTVEPWGLVHWHGRWYLAGHDRDRDATRVFRLGRIVGSAAPVGDPGTVSVPAGVDLRAVVTATEDVPATGTAVVRIAPDSCWQVRRTATEAVEEADGWTRCTLPLGDVDRAAEWLVGYGPQLVVLEPDELRTAVIGRLQEALAGAAT